jgi:hypothetical protein
MDATPSAALDNIEYNIIDGIKIYTGTTHSSRPRYSRSLKYFKTLNEGKPRIFHRPMPSTLTAQGLMSNISFDEKDIIDILADPTGPIMLIGCNFGEKYNPVYQPVKIERKSGRGRKPKPKIKTKRRSQGNGKYFSSQITFVIRHPVSNLDYKIKLFRNGVFQVPGVKIPSMSDLVAPVTILKEYLSENFGEDVQIMNFMAVMRNYKAKVLDEKFRVDLTYLEDVINFYKNYKLFEPFLRREIAPIPKNLQSKAMKFIGKSNLLNIAEINYNTDKCFCLNIKFYRPMPNDPTKKTTVKLLKKGKINFDGGNSEYEMLELYYWLTYIYSTFANEILVDVQKIVNAYDHTMMDGLEAELIYSDDEEQFNAE